MLVLLLDTKTAFLSMQHKHLVFKISMYPDFKRSSYNIFKAAQGSMPVWA